MTKKTKKIRMANLKKTLSKIGIYVVLTFVALCVLAPLYVVLITSFKTKAEAMDPSSHSGQRNLIYTVILKYLLILLVHQIQCQL